MNAIRIGVVGDYNDRNETHRATGAAVDHAANGQGVQAEVTWIATPDVEGTAEQTLAGFDALWIAPGSPYRSMHGALDAITYARTHDVPLLGTCGGFQHMVIEFARNVAGIPDAHYAEYDPNASRLLIDALACSLVGQVMDVTLVEGSGAHQAYRASSATERYYCRFGLNPEYVQALTRSGLVISGTDQDGEPRIMELPGHRFLQESVDRLRLLLLIAVPAALALAGGGGWLLTGKALWPVASMTRQAGAIGTDDLHERVSVPPAHDELALLAETLNTMLDRIERGVTEQRRFLADASHELRTPLAILRAELEVGLRDAHRSNGSAEVLESSIEEVDRMSGIVEGLLTLARADEGRLELLREPVDLGEVAAAVVAKLRPIAEAKRIALTLEGEGPEVVADRARIVQVVTNLLDNAITYTGPGGTIQVRVWQTSDEAGLSVRDSGLGIARTALPRVFDRFFRADMGRSRTGGGSGLGLAICKELAEAHVGRIEAESELGVGSRFAVMLPLHPPLDPR